MSNRTYRYYTGTPLYPFGYGLTYGDTAVTGLAATKDTAMVTVENRGAATEDVVQLYITALGVEGAPKYSLCGMQRVSLGAMESREITLTLPDSAFETVDENGVRSIAASRFTLYAGTSQPDAVSLALGAAPCANTEILL